MQHAGTGVYGARLRALIVVLWRAGSRIHEALALGESDLDQRRGSLLMRRGKGGRRREVDMDDRAWEQRQPWLTARVGLPIGPLLCIATGPTSGRAWSAGAARTELRRAAVRARVRKRFAPHQLRHAHAVEIAPGGRAADRHPPPGRAHQARDHLDLPPGHRRSSPPSTPAARRWFPLDATLRL